MTNFLDIIFTLQLFAVIGFFFVKLWNIFHKGIKLDMRTSVLIFIGWYIAYFLGLMNIMFNTDTIIYAQLFKFERMFIMFNWLFLLVEIFFLMLRKTPEIVSSHNSKMEQLKRV